MAMILTHDEYLALSGDAKRYREQRDQLREALEEAVDRDAFDELGNDAPWLDKARSALKATEEDV